MRPTTPVPSWATEENFASGDETGQTTRLAPSAGTAAAGQLPNQRLPARYFNWLAGGSTDWLRHVVDATDALMLRNWSYREHPSIGDLVLYRTNDNFIYSFATDGSNNAQGSRFSPGLRFSVSIGAEDSSAYERVALTIPNTNGLLLSAAAISASGVMLIGGEPTAGSNDLRRSTDGTTWTEVATGGIGILRSLDWFNAASVFVSGRSGGQVQTSPSGSTWTTRTTPNTNNRGAITSGPNRVLVAAIGVPNSNYIYADATDIATWTAATVNGTTDMIMKFVWSDYWAKWFAFRATGAPFASATADAASWSSSGLADPGVTVQSACAFGRYLIVFGDSRLVRISADGGATWQTLALLTDRVVGELDQNYGSVFVASGLICFGAANVNGRVYSTLSMQGFI